MRGRWMLWLGVAMAIMAVAIAIVLPSAKVPDCPPPSTGVRCEYITDVRVWPRFFIGLIGVLPVLLVIGHRRRGGPWISSTVAVLGTAGGVLLALRTGLVPTSQGDCPPYPQCVTSGRPYLGVAFGLFIGSMVMAIWLWDKDYPKPIGPSSREAPSSEFV